MLHSIRAAVEAGKPAGVNAFDPEAADRYLAAGAAFVLVGADVALLARASEALADRFVGGAPATPDAERAGARRSTDAGAPCRALDRSYMISDTNRRGRP